MKRLTSIACWLLLGLCPPLLGQCGGAAQPGIELGTETGNPPRVDERKLYLVESGESVQLVGEAGAVSPGGATVRVTNLRTGAQVEATAQNDGSISVVIPGSLADGYELSVSNGGEVVNVPVPARAGEESSLDALSCNALEDTLAERGAASFAAADASCTADTDCVLSFGNVGCYFHCGSFRSLAGHSEAVAEVEATTEPVCAELASRCEREAACPGALGPTVPECRGGTCQGLDVDALDCETVSNRASLRLQELLERADRACVTNADCALIDPGVSCVADCGRENTIAASAVPALTDSVDRIESDFCQNFEVRACPLPNLNCVPPQPTTPVCNAGQCELNVLQ